MLPNLGVTELMIIFGIVLVVFGGGKIAGIGKSLGTAITEFKGAIKEGKEEIDAIDKEVKSEPKKPEPEPVQQSETVDAEEKPAD